jgi:hypothetical protein
VQEKELNRDWLFKLLPERNDDVSDYDLFWYDDSFCDYSCYSDSSAPRGIFLKGTGKILMTVFFIMSKEDLSYVRILSDTRFET